MTRSKIIFWLRSWAMTMVNVGSAMIPGIDLSIREKKRDYGIVSCKITILETLLVCSDTRQMCMFTLLWLKDDVKEEKTSSHYYISLFEREDRK